MLERKKKPMAALAVESETQANKILTQEMPNFDGLSCGRIFVEKEGILIWNLVMGGIAEVPSQHGQEASPV
jgi:hypothetical protein